MKLEKCPFCGGEAEIVGGPENWTPTFYDPDSGGGPIAVVCKTCACGLHFFDGYAEAASAWNRRADHIRDATKLVSNADRIRSMNDEELAEYIFGLGNDPENCDGHCAYQDDCNAEGFNYNTCIKACIKGVTDWLRQPLKEE